MITVQVAAIAFFTIRVITIGVAFSVLAQQFRLFKLTIENELASFRITMFLLSLVFLCGCIIPAAVDFYYGFLYASAEWSGLLVLYAASNSISFLAAAVLLRRVYRIVAESLEEEQRIEDREA